MGSRLDLEPDLLPQAGCLKFHADMVFHSRFLDWLSFAFVCLCVHICCIRVFPAQEVECKLGNADFGKSPWCRLSQKCKPKQPQKRGTVKLGVPLWLQKQIGIHAWSLLPQCSPFLERWDLLIGVPKDSPSYCRGNPYPCLKAIL